MPRLQKQTISKFLENECKRQLFLNLQVEKDLDNITYPKRIVRPAIQDVRELGDQWEAEKIEDIVQAFGANRLIGDKSTKLILGTQGQILPVYADVPLSSKLPSASENTFLVQAEYEVPSLFLQQHRLDRFAVQPNPLKLSDLRPDLIWVRSAGTYSQYVRADGRVVDVLPGDTRKQLQIIDIKLTAEPSRRHYVEVVYYILTLAAWLTENGLDTSFVMVPNGSVWPGTYDTSEIIALLRRSQAASITPLVDDLNAALSSDLEPVPFEPISQRLTTFFERDLVEVLTTPDWRNLNWHITQSCSTCDFLGLDAGPGVPRHANHCHIEALSSDKITRIAFLGRGGKSELESQGVTSTAQLGLMSAQSSVFMNHNQLRAERNILKIRAEALAQNTSLVPPGRQTTALPEPWSCDLKIFLTLDFDPGSGLTYAFGFQAVWWPPRPITPSALATPPAPPNRRTLVFIVPDRTPKAERTQLLGILSAIQAVIEDVGKERQQAGYTGNKVQPKVQFYIWDSVQAKHIRRVMGRHINDPQVQQQFQSLIWRFPPENVLPNAELEEKSPVSIVKPVVRQLVGVPLNYDYTLLQTARVYCPSGVSPTLFNVPPLFESGLGDQIPYERAHEIWSQKGYRSAARGTQIPWNTLLSEMEKTVKAKLRALDNVVRRLEKDLASQKRLLLKPKAVKIGRPVRARGVSVDGQLWLSYAKLEAVSKELENQAIRAMDVDEREARYHTAVLERLLQGQEEQDALRLLSIPAGPGILVYKMQPTSSEVKLNVDDFLWALAPADVPGFLDRKVMQLTAQDEALAIQLTGSRDQIWFPLETFTRVRILEIDRDNLLVALLPDNLTFLQEVQRQGLADFTRNVVLDKVYRDYWTSKLERCLRAIGNPDVAKPAPESQSALLQ
jgi:DNA replication ATP-dependent helicase Dna2